MPSLLLVNWNNHDNVIFDDDDDECPIFDDDIDIYSFTNIYIYIEPSLWEHKVLEWRWFLSIYPSP